MIFAALGVLLLLESVLLWRATRRVGDLSIALAAKAALGGAVHTCRSGTFNCARGDSLIVQPQVTGPVTIQAETDCILTVLR